VSFHHWKKYSINIRKSVKVGVSAALVVVVGAAALRGAAVTLMNDRPQAIDSCDAAVP
jgi:hypothetical protein